MTYLLLIVLAYLIGAIPTAIIVGKVVRGIDIRQHGSGNAGGTNVFRVLGWQPGVLVMLFDVFKGFVAAEWIPLLAGTNLSIPFAALQLLCGIAAIVGHIWTVFAGFRGGKGVGTAAGMLLALHPLAVLICFAIFLVVLFATRIVSISSISGAVAFPLLLTLFRYLGKPVADSLYYFSFFAAALIIFTHRSNIRRLLNGTENKFGKKK